MKKKLLPLILTLSLLLALAAPALAATTAATIKLSKTSGTVTVSKSSGKALTMMRDMRLYNGYHVKTSASSYAWMNLDDTKLIKEDVSSEVEVRKSGNNLEVYICSGNVFFNVSEKLTDNESLNISTSTMIVGIRGTAGYVQVRDRWTTDVTILEGSTQCTVTDPVTGQTKTQVIRGGQTATCVVYPQEQPGEKCDILMEQEPQPVTEIPGFVLTDVVRDMELCDRIEADTDTDILEELAKVAGGDPSGRSEDGTSASPEILGEADHRETTQAEQRQEAQEAAEEQAEEEQPESIAPDKALMHEEETPSTGGGSIGGSTGGDTPTVPIAPSSITFDANGGTLTGGSSAVTTAEGRLSALPTDPTAPAVGKGGYSFGGWYTAAEGGDLVTANTVFTADTTVYAHWAGWHIDGTTLYVSGDGPMEDYTYTGNPAPWASDAGTLQAAVVRRGITSIGNCAFYDCANLASITIPDSVTSIGDHAFRDCIGLTTVKLPDNLTSIGGAAFCGCTSLTGITIPDGVASIGGLTFYGCTSLTGIIIPDRVTSIGASAFYGCSSLTSIDIPAGVTSIGDSVFEDCKSLTGIIIPDRVTSIGASAFNGCTGLTSITIPNGVTSIGNYAFSSCTGLTSVTIPAGVTSIGDSVFEGCSRLATVTILGNVTSIEKSTFAFCTDLTSVTIPDSVTSIWGGAFLGCTNLTSVNIPNGVSIIADSVFEGCSRLATVTILGNVTSIEKSTFAFCTDLTSVILPASVESIDASAFENVGNCTVTLMGGTPQYQTLGLEENHDAYGADLTYVDSEGNSLEPVQP